MRRGTYAARVRDRLTLGTCWLLLVVAGVLLALVGSFLVPQRLLGVPGIALVVALLGNAGTGILGGRAGGLIGAAVPQAAWIVVALLAASTGPGGDVIVPGRLPSDPWVSRIGVLFIVAGIAGAGIGFFLVTRRRFTGRPGMPTSPV